MPNLRRTFLCIVAGAIALLGDGAPSAVLTSVRDVDAATRSPSGEGRCFAVTGEVLGITRAHDKGFHLQLGQDGSRIPFCWNPEPSEQADALDAFELGDRVCVDGTLIRHPDGIWAHSRSVRRLSSAGLDALPVLTPRDLILPQWLHRAVRLDGTVRDAARDESDPAYLHLAINQDGDNAQIMIAYPIDAPFDPLHYLGARVSAYGFCHDNAYGLRKHIGQILQISNPKHLRIRTPPAKPNDAPDIEDLADAFPRAIDGQGLHRTEGSVIASWGGNQLLLQTDCGRIVRISLQHQPSPACGTRIRAIGLPATDYYHLNLLHGIWQATGRNVTLPLPTQDTSPAVLMAPKGVASQLKVTYHGTPLKMTGTVRYLPFGTPTADRLQVEVDGQLVPVDASAVPEVLPLLSVGCRVSVTGTCVINSDNWRLDSTDQKPMGFFLALRTPADIVVLSRPSWWTPGRLMALLGLLAAALLGVIGWNVSLNRRAHRKGKELAAAQLAHVTSELKVSERTRLAVELHDALSQTLTGVSMQIDTAAGTAEGKMPTVTKCLHLASRTIDACRMELRNTLWDLRSAALDDPSMDAAIRKTLCQNLAGIDLTVRFNVPRETFSDNTAHAILKIIRELATNAIRHGKATSLKIAGAVEGGKLLFSVTDNGCGFDPDLAPGIAEGHFGLQGVAERLERLNGEMTINSTLGKGTKVTVTLAIPSTGN